MFKQQLNDALSTVESPVRAALVAVFLKTSKDLGRQIEAKNPPAVASRVRTWLDERLLDIAVHLGPDMASGGKMSRPA